MAGWSLWMAGCGSATEPPFGPASGGEPLAEVDRGIVQDPCALATLPVEGPLEHEIVAGMDPVAVARVRIREAGLTSDPGFDTLAELSLECALRVDPSSIEAARWLGYVDIQFHRFAEAEARMESLYARTGAWHDALILGDARMEQGDLAGAAAAYDDAMAVRPGLETYDRAANLRWLEGDLDGAVDLEQRAVSAATPSDPEPMAFVLTRLGVLRALRGERPDELGVALTVLPGYAPAELALGRWFLATGDPERARPHLVAAGPTVEAARALAEIDPAASVAAVQRQDRRGYALWLASTDPAAALPLLDAELGQRRDAMTRLARAWAASRLGADVGEEVRAALATGCSDPLGLLLAAEALGSAELAARALAAAPGLLPSEQVRARRIVADGDGR